MKLLRAATLVVADVDRSVELYTKWLDYEEMSRGPLSQTLADAWGAPGCAGLPYAVLRPESGAEIYLRFIEQPPHPDYKPLRTYGWQAIEICVEDVLKVNERMLKSPFEIIGPPKEIDGLPAIFPMQVKGPDDEIVYLTQIRDDLPVYDLPRAESMIDRMFIHVLACSDLEGTLGFAKEKLGLEFGRTMEIVYTMLANSFAVPHERLFKLATVVHGRDVFLEFDQMPAQATPRPMHAGLLPPGFAMSSLTLPDFDERVDKYADWLIGPPSAYDDWVYSGRRAATMRGPDGTLYELVSP